jgi:hypothetical protein
MGKLIAIICTLGLFGATTLTPAAAGGGKHKSATASTDKTKKPTKAKKAKKTAAVILYRIAS